ncbi:MAG: ABC-type transport auxiliary lipoprotein family protein [Lysobacterales bacterium]
MNPMRRILLLVMPPLLLLGGCSSLLTVQRAPFTIYSPSYTATSSAGPHVDWQLMVETPLASDTLDTARMLVMPTPGVLEVFPAARWRDTAPALLRSIVVQGFENSGRILGVGSATSGLHADLALAIDLRDFQLEATGGAAQAAVRFQARLLDYTTNRVLATHAFAVQTPAAGNDAASAFAAFEAALNTVVPQLVDWTLEQGTAARGTGAPRGDSPQPAQRRQ